MNEVAELIEDLEVLLDTNAPPASRTVNIDANLTIDQVQFRLRREFNAIPSVPCVQLVVAGAVVGLVTRRSLARADDTVGGASANPYEFGAGERMTLAGNSTRYQLLAFECSECGLKAHRVFYDERDLPGCAQHGGMRLVR